MKTNEPLIRNLQGIIHVAVRIMAILMVFVIIMGVVDVGWSIYKRIVTPPTLIMTIQDMLATFGAFMAVLIAIEIFINITVYLRDDAIHVKIVMATALMAIARKVIILDLEKTEPEYLFGIAAIVFSISVGYWLVVKSPCFNIELMEHEKHDHRLGVSSEDIDIEKSTAKTNTEEQSK